MKYEFAGQTIHLEAPADADPTTVERLAQRLALVIRHYDPGRHNPPGRIQLELDETVSGYRVTTLATLPQFELLPNLRQNIRFYLNEASEPGRRLPLVAVRPTDQERAQFGRNWWEHDPDNREWIEILRKRGVLSEDEEVERVLNDRFTGKEHILVYTRKICPQAASPAA